MRKNKYVMRKYKYRYEMRKGRGVADRDYRDLSGFLVSNQIPNPCFQKNPKCSFFVKTVVLRYCVRNSNAGACDSISRLILHSLRSFLTSCEEKFLV